MSTKVFVYWNIHRNLWSVKALEGVNKGRVIYHTSNITLYNCQFKVSEAGRQRVIREQCKNVHAGIQGTELDGIGMFFKDEAFPVTYNPYKYSSFVRKDTGEPVLKAGCVALHADRSVLAQT